MEHEKRCWNCYRRNAWIQMAEYKVKKVYRKRWYWTTEWKLSVWCAFRGHLVPMWEGPCQHWAGVKKITNKGGGAK